MAYQLINIKAIKSVPVTAEPFPYMVVNHSLIEEYLPKIQDGFPMIQDAGSFPLSTVKYNGYFAQLINELKSDEFRNMIAEKFNMNLENRPVMITVRGKADRKDGRIHTDSKSKVITVLLYMNEAWQPDEGRLRLLHDNYNLENYFAEIPPNAGTMLIFKVTENGWHGHKKFVGTRKVLQLNYVINESALNKHSTLHRISAKFKELRRKFLR